MTYWILASLFSLCVGSFLNVVIYRYPKMLMAQWQKEAEDFLQRDSATSSTEASAATPHVFNLAFPDSHCPNCQHPIAWWHNIPLISYVCLLGRCAFCKTSIAWQYPFVELLTLLLTLACFFVFGWHLATAFPIGLCYGLIILTMIDLKHQLLPDVFTLGLLWLGLLYHALFPTMVLSQAIIGAILGYGILWCIGTLFKYARKVEGMGYGDYKLLAVIGAWFGPIPVIFGMLLASVLSLIISFILMAVGKANRQTPLPFGPYLAFAALVILFLHPMTIIHWVFML